MSSGLQSVCADCVKCTTACILMQDLLEDKRIKDLVKFYDDELKQLLLCCSRDSKNLIFWSQLNTQELDLQLLKAIQTKYADSSIFLGICDTSSNVVYFEANGDILEKI